MQEEEEIVPRTETVAAPDWRRVNPGRGLWFRGRCTNILTCASKNQLVKTLPFMEYSNKFTGSNVIKYVWRMNTSTTKFAAKCVCCGSSVELLEINLTQCFYRLHGVKVVSEVECVEYRGKWTEANARTGARCWEEVNENGGMRQKWDALTIYVQIGGKMPKDAPDIVQSAVSSLLGKFSSRKKTRF